MDRMTAPGFVGWCLQFVCFARRCSAADRRGPQRYASCARQRGWDARVWRWCACRRNYRRRQCGQGGSALSRPVNLDVGPNASVRLNKFIYDPNRSGGKAVLDAAKGSFRFSTGAQGGNRNYQVKTPYGTLGIRG
jgi:hypothetical protein